MTSYGQPIRHRGGGVGWGGGGGKKGLRYPPLHWTPPLRPLIQHKLEVLSQAGLAKADFSSADSTVMRDPDQWTLDQLLQFDDLAPP